MIDKNKSYNNNKWTNSTFSSPAAYMPPCSWAGHNPTTVLTDFVRILTPHYCWPVLGFPGPFALPLSCTVTLHLLVPSTSTISPLFLILSWFIWFLFHWEEESDNFPRCIYQPTDMHPACLPAITDKFCFMSKVNPSAGVLDSISPHLSKDIIPFYSCVLHYSLSTGSCPLAWKMPPRLPHLLIHAHFPTLLYRRTISRAVPTSPALILLNPCSRGFHCYHFT